MLKEKFLHFNFRVRRKIKKLMEDKRKNYVFKLIAHMIIDLGMVSNPIDVMDVFPGE